MRVAQGGVLRPADAYSEKIMMGYQVGREIEITLKSNLSYWRRRRYHQICDLIVQSCDMPQKSGDELHEVLKYACGVTRTVIQQDGSVLTYPGTTTELLDPQFDEYYEGAMAWLYEWTGVDAETLEKEVSFEPEHEAPDDGAERAAITPPPAAAPSVGEGDGGGPTPRTAAVDPSPGVATAIERQTTAALKQEAITKLLRLATDATFPIKDDRLREIRKQRADWDKYLIGHPDFVRHVFSTAEKVVIGEMTLQIAQKYLFALKDG
jgi:hypothetical protein